ncbi:quinol dehydrogenase ferredoxin subunit NapH [Kaarinaea lacus]
MNKRRSGDLTIGGTTRGWIVRHKYLLLRRLSQLGFLGLFLLGPLAGIWIVKGSLISSLTLETLPLTDPFVLSQAMLTGHWPENTALLGGLIVIVFYALIGGRVYCAWICPVNIVTDIAHWLRSKLGFRKEATFSRNTRYWLLGAVMVATVISGMMVWELVNPVTITYRAIIFGGGLAWLMIVAIFLFEMVISEHGWCGRLCPMGALYSLLGKFSLVRVNAVNRRQCDDCMDCYEVCPEPQVISPALKGEARGLSSVILSANCTNCGRCIDVCSREIFQFSNRFSHANTNIVSPKKEIVT